MKIFLLFRVQRMKKLSIFAALKEKYLWKSKPEILR